jgi:hypothetical protein
MPRKVVTDPVEKIIADALGDIPFTMEGEPEHPEGSLDFYVPSWGVFIEVKRFHSPRISDQMSRQPNVIAVQGMDAAIAFAELIHCFHAILPPDFKPKQR